MTPPAPKAPVLLITCDGLQALIDALEHRAYRVVGPVVRDGAIVFDAVASVEDLPAGWTDHQDAGRYRVQRRDDGALFGFAVGPQSWKRFLHPPVETLWTARRDGNGFAIAPQGATTLHGLFPDSGAYGFPAPVNILRQADVN